MNQIKWGLMGAGRMSGWFAEALSILPDANRNAIGSRDFTKGKQFAKTYGFQKAYASYEELVNDPEIDIIYIGTPVRHHYDSLMLALNAEKPVLCEKALTVNGAQAQEAYALARKKNLFFMEAMDCLRHQKTQSDLVPPDESLAMMDLLDTLRAKWGLKYDFEI